MWYVSLQILIPIDIPCILLASCRAITDPYENIYTVIRGSKHFILFPPTEGFLLAERTYPRAAYTRSPTPGAPLVLTPFARNVELDESHDEHNSDDEDNQSDRNADTDLEQDVDMGTVSWASVDPSAAAPIKHAMPLRISVHAGQTLYLPAGTSFSSLLSLCSSFHIAASNLPMCFFLGWWHHVTQSGDGPEGRGVCIAINWWYDLEMRGDRWVWLSALRRASQAQRVR